jgi:hypothetical protein
MSFYSNDISKEVTQWLHTENEYDFTPAQFIGYVVKLFKSSLKRFHLYLDVTEEEFTKSICDAVCTFYLSKKTFKGIRGPLREFTYPQGWSTLCEDSWQDVIIFTFFTIEYWDAFWEHSEFSPFPELVHEIQPFLTTILPMYVRRSTDVLVDKKFVVKDGNTYIRWEPEYEENAEDDYDTYHVKTKKQKKLLNDTSN